MSNFIIEKYVTLRKESKDEDAQKKSHTYTSPRTLLGVLRVAQALARLRFSDDVTREDVEEALRLMEVSKKSLHDDEEDAQHHDRSDVSKIFRLIKDMAKQAQGGKKGRRTRGNRRLGKGPGGEREMDVDEDEEEEDAEELSMVDIRSRILSSGFTEAQLMETIIEVCLNLRFLVWVTVLTPVTVRKPGHLDASREQLEAAFHRDRLRIVLPHCFCRRSSV